MSTTSPPAPTRAGTLDVSTSTSPPFVRLVRVELRKSVDTRAGFWLLLTTALISVLAMVGILFALVHSGVKDGEFTSFVGSTAFTTLVFLPIVGLMLVTGEWGQRTAMVSFALVPARWKVIVAKLVAGWVLALLIGLLAFAFGAVCNLLYAAFAGVSPDWHLDAALVFGYLVSQLLVMTFGFALATLLLNTAAAIVLYFVIWWVLPIVLALVGTAVGWIHDLQPWIDIQTAVGQLIGGSASGQQWGHLATAALLWIVLPVSLGLWRVLRAEVK